MWSTTSSLPLAAARYQLHRVLYAQEAHILKHGHYAKELQSLGLADLTDPSLAEPIQLESNDRTYTVSAKVKLPDGKTATLNVAQDARTWSQ